MQCECRRGSQHYTYCRLSFISSDVIRKQRRGSRVKLFQTIVVVLTCLKPVAFSAQLPFDIGAEAFRLVRERARSIKLRADDFCR